MSSRSYTSPVREAAKEQTRQAILQALVDVVIHEGVHAFTMQNVAKKAGVSQRTVYRHFDSREALLDGLSEEIDQRFARAGVPTQPKDLDALASQLVGSMATMGTYADELSAYVVVSIALGRQAPDAIERTQAFRNVLRRAYPNLPEQEVRDGAAMVRHICSSRTWYLLSHEQGLGNEDVARAAGWSVRCLLDDLARRDRAASLNPGSP